jgi:hypothetical protein
VFAISGLRAYYGLFLVGAFVGAAVVLLVTAGADRVRVVFAHSIAIPAVWLVFVAGAGAYYPYYGSLVRATLGLSPVSFAELDKARAAFAATGGGTAIADADGSIQAEVRDESTADRLGRGLASMFIPISVLREAGVVKFSGGRGLLFLTDIDTIMLDLSLILSFVLLFKIGRRTVPSVIMFGLLVFLVTAFTMAYVVTNYGTLFRLRLLVAAPIWMLPAFAQKPDRSWNPVSVGGQAGW